MTTLIAEKDGFVGGVLTDQLGYVYIADFQETLWRLNPETGEMNAWATGFYGASGNTLDKNGVLYQANFYGNSINRVSRNGEVTTVVDDGLAGPVGMVFNSENELLVCNCNDQTIKKVSLDGTVSEFAKSEHFVCPNGITMGPEGNFYVVSFSGSKIVKITPEGETSEFADSGGNGLGHITFANGVLYATSFTDNRVFRVTLDGQMTVLAGSGTRGQVDGVGEAAEFSSPNGIAADSTGAFLYINDYLGEVTATGLATTPFSVRRIELPNLGKILDHALANDGVSGMTRAYEAYRSDPGHAGENTMNAINAMGWRYMTNNQLDVATALMELNARDYADQWRVHSILGAVYMRDAENEKAIAALQRSLELNPENSVAKGRLEELGVVD